MEGDLDLPLKVAQAVHVLNHDTLSCNRIAANQWLVQFQQSSQAWSVATSILTSDDRHLPNFEAEFFAAQILKRKIQVEGSSLQLPAKEALLNALLQAAGRFSVGPPQLLTQICLALSALILRAVEYKKPIEQLFSSLPNLQCQENGCAAVLEMLTVLPEEVIEDQNLNCSIDSTSRFRFTQELLSQTPNVLNFLLAQSERPESGISLYERNKKILRCLLSWVRAGCFSEIPVLSLPTHPMLDFIFNALLVSSLFEMAIEVLTELVSRYEGVPQVLLSRVHNLNERLLIPAFARGDEKVICRLACLLSEVGQAVPGLIAEAGGQARILVETLLSCVAFAADDWEIADSTLQFWCCLASYLLSLDVVSRKEKMEDAFASIYSTLLDALLLRAQVEPCLNDGSENFDIPDGLLHFRLNLEELLIDICQLMGPSWFLQKIFSRGCAAVDMQIPWSEVEARMFVLNVVSEIILEEGFSFDISIVMRLIEILSTTASEKFKGFKSLVYKSVADVVTSYSKLIFSVHENIRPILLFCACGITETISSSSCSSTLRSLCEDSSISIHDPSDFEVLVWIGEGLRKSRHSVEEEEEVVGAITIVLGSLDNKDLKNSMFARLLSSCCDALERLIVADGQPFYRRNSAVYIHAINDAVRGLYRMGAIFGNLHPGPSIAVRDDSSQYLLHVVWPFLEKLFQSIHIEDNNLSAAACRCISLAVEASGEYFLEFLPKVLDCLSKSFLSFPSHECYIKTATVVIKEFGNQEEFGSLFVNAFERFTSATSIIAISSSYVCDQEPDLVEAYTNFASTYVRSCLEDVLVASGSPLELSFQKAAICCTAMHRGAALSAMSFMSCFLELTLSSLMESVTSITEVSLSAVTVKILFESGEGLVSNVIYALLGVSAMSRVQKSASILQKVAAICHLSEQTRLKTILCWESLHGWLHSAVTSLPAEYLKPGEVKSLVPLWLDTLSNAAGDAVRSMNLINRSFMQGKGAQALKRIIRDFAETHRNSPSPL